MLIPVLPLREILPPEAALYSVAQPHMPSHSPPLLVFDPVDPRTGFFLEDIELLLLQARTELPPTRIGLHLTYWPAAFAYGAEWGLDFLLYHEPTLQAMQGVSLEGPFLDSLAGWTPPPPWKLLSAEYRPTSSQVAQMNAFLQALSTLRKAVAVQPEQSSLLRTQSATETYLHLTLPALQAHVATLRR